jgi:hypothetical protein
VSRALNHRRQIAAMLRGIEYTCSNDTRGNIELGLVRLQRRGQLAVGRFRRQGIFAEEIGF